MQPVYVGDVATAIAAASAGKTKPGTIYELGGPHIVSLREMFDMTLSWTGRNRWYLPIPLHLAKFLAATVAPLPAAVRPVTRDEVKCLEHSNVVSQVRN